MADPVPPFCRSCHIPPPHICLPHICPSPNLLTFTVNLRWNRGLLWTECEGQNGLEMGQVAEQLGYPARVVSLMGGVRCQAQTQAHLLGK